MMMTQSRPYLIRAIYEWIVDNECTPYIVINANSEGVQVPEEYVEDGRIILNISPAACRGLHLENDRIVFSARFGGVAQQIFAPPLAILAIYAKENGRGMVFTDEQDEDGGDGKPPIPPPTDASDKSDKKASPKRPQLKVIK